MTSKYVLGLCLVLVAQLMGGCKASKEYAGVSPGGDGGEAGAPSTTSTSSGGAGGSTSSDSTVSTGGAAGAGSSVECEPHELRCNDLVPEACSEQGVWQALRAACAVDCFEGSCAACPADATQCQDGAVEQCVDGVEHCGSLRRNL